MATEIQARMSADEIRALMRLPKACLAARVKQAAQDAARDRGREIRWVLGGPETWSKDELVSQLVQHENQRRGWESA